MAGIPLRPEDRRPEDPIVLMGGVCAFANPEPVAPFMDFVVVGEGEEIVGEIVAAYREAFGATSLAARRRGDLLDRLAPIPGIYVPQRYAVSYRDDGTIAEVRPEDGVPAIVTKRRLKKVDEFRTMSLLRTPERGVRPPRPPRGREGMRARLPLLPGGADLPARSATGASRRSGRRCARSRRTRTASGSSGRACPTIRGSAG